MPGCALREGKDTILSAEDCSCLLKLSDGTAELFKQHRLAVSAVKEKEHPGLHRCYYCLCFSNLKNSRDTGISIMPAKANSIKDIFRLKAWAR